MARDKGRLDLPKDMCDALASHLDLEPSVTAVLARFELRSLGETRRPPV